MQNWTNRPILHTLFAERHKKLAQFRRTERVNVIQYIRLILCRFLENTQKCCNKKFNPPEKSIAIKLHGTTSQLNHQCNSSDIPTLTQKAKIQDKLYLIKRFQRGILGEFNTRSCQTKRCATKKFVTTPNSNEIQGEIIYSPIYP